MGYLLLILYIKVIPLSLSCYSTLREGISHHDTWRASKLSPGHPPPHSILFLGHLTHLTMFGTAISIYVLTIPKCVSPAQICHGAPHPYIQLHIQFLHLGVSGTPGSGCSNRTHQLLLQIQSSSRVLCLILFIYLPTYPPTHHGACERGGESARGRFSVRRDFAVTGNGARPPRGSAGGGGGQVAAARPPHPPTSQSLRCSWRANL